MATLDAVLGGHLSFRYIIDSNLTTGPHAQRELRACPIIPMVLRIVILIQVAAGAGTVTPFISCQQQLLPNGLVYSRGFKLAFHSTQY